MKALLLGLVVSLLALTPLHAQDGSADADRSALAHYNLERGLALSGYDPVSYFAEGGSKPTKGKRSFEARHRGVTYRFASERNRDLFTATPARYEPAYGGWCAYAVGKTGEKVEVDPKSYLLENGQLLLFYKGFLNNTRKKWSKEGNRVLGPKADANWKRISGEQPGPDLRVHNLGSGAALGGYDPVGYRDGKALRGLPNLVTVHDGVSYFFSSEASRARFLEKPGEFAASYGGWCAWAMAQGKQVEVDPESFVVADGELYLFYNNDKRDEWTANRGLKPKADGHWQRLAGPSGS